MAAAPVAVVEELRELILMGELRPGDHLDEVGMAGRLAVSRNTVREGFRLLAQEGLVEHRSNRGVFVRRPSVKELRDAYAVRRMLESGALRQVAAQRALGEFGEGIDEERWQQRVSVVEAAVASGVEAAERGDWPAVGTANGQFHLAVAALGDNAVVDRTMRVLVTEMRLLFVVVGSAQEVHEPYLIGNRRVAALIRADSLVEASVEMEHYLIRAENHLVGAYEELASAGA